jgi:hypothetical protein
LPEGERDNSGAELISSSHHHLRAYILPSEIWI